MESEKKGTVLVGDGYVGPNVTGLDAGSVFGSLAGQHQSGHSLVAGPLARGRL